MISCVSWYYIQMPEGEGYLSRTFTRMNKWSPAALVSHMKATGSHQHRKLFIMWSFLNWGLIIILWRWLGSHTNTGQARLVSNWPWKDLMISVQQKCLMKIRVHLSHICSGIKCIYDDIYIHVCKWNVKCKDTTSLITTHYDIVVTEIYVCI